VKPTKRSKCPISGALEVFGDRWTLLVLRDMVFYDRRYFQDFLESPEGIATKVLADRLARLEEQGLVEKRPDPADRRRSVYSLTEQGLGVIPVLLELRVWGSVHDPSTWIGSEYVAEFTSDRDGMIRRYRERLSDSGRAPGPPLLHGRDVLGIGAREA
jgi:DNA-binding HxlR family transcriptional regulator